MTGSPDEVANFASLVDWVDGRLSPERAELVAARVAEGDPRVRAIVDWVRAFVATGRELPLEQSPPIIRQRLNTYFEQWWEEDRALHEEISRFDAAILFDSRSALVPVGARGVVADEVVHLAYTTGSADLVLDIQRLVGHRVRIDGQVLVTGTGGAPVFEATVTGPGFTLRTVDGDVLGRFRLDDVPDDAHSLVVTNGRITVSAPLDLRADVP